MNQQRFGEGIASVFCVLALFWLVGPAHLYSQEAMFRGNPQHTGVYGSKAVSELHGVKWKFKTQGRIFSSPAISGGVVYIGSEDHHLYAIDARSGNLKWKFKTEGEIDSTPAVSRGGVFFMSYDGNFYGLDSKDGRLKWKFKTEGERRSEARGLDGMRPRTQMFPNPWDYFLSSAGVDGDRVIFGCGDSRVYALDVRTGALIWKFQTGDVVHTSPALAGGTVYLGSFDNYFYALDAKTGGEKWKFKTGEDPQYHNQSGIQSSAAVADGTVYFGCRDAHLYALEAATGKEKWNFSTKGSWIIGSPAVKKGMVYFGTSDSTQFFGLERETGREIYATKLKAYIFSSPALADDIAYVGGFDGKLAALDTASGKILWEFRTDGYNQNSSRLLSPEGKFNYEKTEDGTLGTYNWVILQLNRFLSLGSILSSPAVADRLVYFGSTDGNLYAIF